MMSSTSREVSLNSSMHARLVMVLIILFRFSFLPLTKEVVDFFLQYFSFCSISSSSNAVSND